MRGGLRGKGENVEMVSYRRSESGFRMTKGYRCLRVAQPVTPSYQSDFHEACSPYTGLYRESSQTAGDGSLRRPPGFPSAVPKCTNSRFALNEEA